MNLEELEQRIRQLPDKRRDFLLARLMTNTDTEAAQVTSISRTSIQYWRNSDPEFDELYKEVLQSKSGILRASDIMPEDLQVNVVEITVRALEQYAHRIPEMFARLFDMIENGKNSEALKAIELVAKWYGISPEVLQNTHLSSLQQNILNWTQVRVERSDDRDCDNQTQIEATFREMPAE